MFSNFFPENRAVYEIMSENMVELGRPQMTIWRLRVAYWISKARRAQTRPYPRQLWFRKRSVLLRCTCIAYLVLVCPLRCL